MASPQDVVVLPTSLLVGVVHRMIWCATDVSLSVDTHVWHQTPKIWFHVSYWLILNYVVGREILPGV